MISLLGSVESGPPKYWEGPPPRQYIYESSSWQTIKYMYIIIHIVIST